MSNGHFNQSVNFSEANVVLLRKKSPLRLELTRNRDLYLNGHPRGCAYNLICLPADVRRHGRIQGLQSCAGSSPQPVGGFQILHPVLQ